LRYRSPQLLRLQFC